MKIQQQQKEMTMKPWERDIQELERYFAKTMEAENMKLNSTAIYQQPCIQEDASGRQSVPNSSSNLGSGPFNGTTSPNAFPSDSMTANASSNS